MDTPDCTYYRDYTFFYQKVQISPSMSYINDYALLAYYKHDTNGVLLGETESNM
jgi:hypothetical protein